VRCLLALSCCLVFAAAVEAADPAPHRLPVNRQAKPITAAAEGTLRRNGEARRGEPPYALLDSEGHVTHLVMPQSGVNLAKYEGRNVRLSGAQRSLPRQVPTFAAQSVQPIMQDQAFMAADDGPIAPVAFEEEIGDPIAVEAEGEPYYEDPLTTMRAGMPMGQQFGPRPVLGGWYMRAEYLYWWADGMQVPALVTTSPNGTSRTNAGVLGEPGTSILFGNSGLNNDGQSGGRISFGRWLECYPGHAIEGDYWGLGTINDGFFASSPGNPILARPFFDINNARESSELVAFPAVVAGSVLVDPSTRVQGAGLRKRWQLCGCLDCDPCNPCCCDGWGVDWTAGYRFMRLDDSLTIREDLTSLDTANPGAFIVQDQFATRNTFNGGEVGTILTSRHGRWSLEALGRIAVGSTHSQVRINGFTDITPAGGATTRNTGGLLAQRTNIGTYERDDLAVIPEFGLTAGWQLNPCWRITFGYSFIYWSNVVRAGQQIDRDINTNLLPPEANPFSGNLRPRFVFNDTDFFVQGINVGLDARW
jgi:hypothetical protein